MFKQYQTTTNILNNIPKYSNMSKLSKNIQTYSTHNQQCPNNVKSQTYSRIFKRIQIHPNIIIYIQTESNHIQTRRNMFKHIERKTYSILSHNYKQFPKQIQRYPSIFKIYSNKPKEVLQPNVPNNIKQY